jgi:hypothetical protein
MLLWSGIEGLLSVDGELNRRLALYAALMLEGSADEKVASHQLKSWMRWRFRQRSCERLQRLAGQRGRSPFRQHMGFDVESVLRTTHPRNAIWDEPVVC